MAMDDRGTGSEIAHGKHVRSDVAISDPLKTHQIHQIQKNLQSPTFEMQIRKIDEAIMGGAIISKNLLSAESVPEISADLQNTAQSTRVNEGNDKQENKVESWVGLKEDLGLKYGLLNLTTTISYKLNMTTAHETKGGNFFMGQQTPKS